MFKKAKRVNLRRRNESDEDEKEDIQQTPLPQQLAPQTCGPAAGAAAVDAPEFDNIDFAVGARNVDYHHGNGFQSNALKAVKKEKKNRDTQGGPSKASLLSFDDDEGRANTNLDNYISLASN